MGHQVLIIIEKELPSATVAKVTAALSMQLGSKELGVVAPEVVDSDGNTHCGRVQIEYPILRTSHEDICLLLEAARAYPDEIDVFDLNSFAAVSKTNDEYVDMIQTSPAGEIEYKGIALYGDKEVIRHAVKDVLR